MAFRTREQRVKQRTEVVNALRSRLYELGHKAPGGIGYPELVRIIERWFGECLKCPGDARTQFLKWRSLTIRAVEKVIPRHSAVAVIPTRWYWRRTVADPQCL